MISDIKLRKRFLREVYLDRRKDLSLYEALLKSKKISKNALDLAEIKGRRSFLVYLPVNKEVRTNLIIEKLQKGGAIVSFPCYSKKSKGYFLAKFGDWQDLEEGPYKILQPRNPVPVDPKLIEVAFVPGIAFSKTGVRLGYGGGIFDGLLSGTNAVKIGLAYDFQIASDEIPREKHDLLVDIIVTEKRVLRS